MKVHIDFRRVGQIDTTRQLTLVPENESEALVLHMMTGCTRSPTEIRPIETGVEKSAAPFSHDGVTITMYPA